MTLRLCEHFHCLPSELDKQDVVTLNRLTHIISVEGEKYRDVHEDSDIDGWSAGENQKGE